MNQNNSNVLRNFCLLIPTIHLIVITFMSVIATILVGGFLSLFDNVTTLSYLFIGSPVLLTFNLYAFWRKVKYKQKAKKVVLWATIISCIYIASFGLVVNQSSSFALGYLILSGLTIIEYLANK